MYYSFLKVYGTLVYEVQGAQVPYDAFSNCSFIDLLVYYHYYFEMTHTLVFGLTVIVLIIS